MSEPAAQQPEIDAAALEPGCRPGNRGLRRDLRSTVIALIVANSALERELADVYAKASPGYIRGRRVKLKADM